MCPYRSDVEAGSLSLREVHSPIEDLHRFVVRIPHLFVLLRKDLCQKIRLNITAADHSHGRGAC